MPEERSVSGEIADLFDEASGDVAVGELEAAVEKYRRCTQLAPDFFDGWHALEMTLMKTGRFPEAIEAVFPRLCHRYLLIYFHPQGGE